MKIGIMQPYLFPYIGYFQLIANTDKWIFFDVVQYNNKSWMNRNRILHPDQNKDFQYITVPIKKHEKGTLIKYVEINTKMKWEQDIIGKLTLYRRLRAKYYNEIVNIMTTIFEHHIVNFLDLSILSIKKICTYIGIGFNYEIASNIKFDRNIIGGPGDWALSITKEIGGNVYINPPGGHTIFNEDKYKKHGIELRFLKANLTPYKQSKRATFTPGLSIIDVLMFNGPDEIRTMLNNDFKYYSKEQLKRYKVSK